ncbi:integrating conjugative element protein, PFL_4701 family [Bordetella hinzii 5132]|nr:integrating conjugative element protein, PFL_4701 family [Bordetella hinzii 5132]
MNAAQVSAFQANGGFAPAAVATVVLGLVFAVLLLWGVWAMRTAYTGWAEQRLPSASSWVSSCASLRCTWC